VDSIIGTRERDTYRDVWGTLGSEYDTWSPGVEYLPLFLSRIGDTRGTLIDAGCGSGRASVQLAAAGFSVLLCDLTDDGLDDSARGIPFLSTVLWRDLMPVAYLGDVHYSTRPPRPSVDYVYCCDVLEHIPEALTMLTVHRLCAVARREVFLVVSHELDRSGFWVGRPLHHTVQSFVWWRDHLAEVTEILEARDLIHHGVFWLKGQA
jgi:2-polyprenyl-3-methyl-5-hydroxy-6-metoxy-1,4-benzoquinol methylase